MSRTLKSRDATIVVPSDQTLNVDGQLNAATLKYNQTDLLPNYKHIEGTDFPDTTQLYAWELSGASDFDGSELGSNPALDLVEVGSTPFAAATNHLGESVYCDLSAATSSGAAHTSSGTFDTDDEAFTTGGWFSGNNNGTFVSKYNSGIAAERSFTFYKSGDTLAFIVYDGTTTIHQRITPFVFETDKLYHLVCVYNPAATGTQGSMEVYINGKIVDYYLNTALTTRQNVPYTDAALCFGCRYYDNTTTSTGLDGQMQDVFYKKDVLEFEEIRAIYIAGSKKLGYVDENDKVQIAGEVGPKGQGSEVLADTSAQTNTAYETKLTSYVPVEGLYRVRWDGTYYIYDIDSSGQCESEFRLISNVGNFQGKEKKMRTNTTTHILQVPASIEEIVYITSGDFSMQGLVSSGDRFYFLKNKMSWELLD